MTPFLAIADRAARQAGQIIIRAMDQPDRVRTYEKQDNHFVTNIDREVEAYLIKSIRMAYPNHSILSEECGALPGSSDYTWIIDPIDGTTNFMHSLPGFAISIGVQYKNHLEQALVYDPLRQETFYATRGQGTRLGQQRLRVSNQAQLKKSLLYLNYPSRELNRLTDYTEMLAPLLKEAAGIRYLGSAALGLAYVAAGRLDGLWSTHLKPWDMAAGALLVQEAGGIVCDADEKDAYLETGTIIAANPKLHRYFFEAVRSFSAAP